MGDSVVIKKLMARGYSRAQAIVYETQLKLRGDELEHGGSTATINAEHVFTEHDNIEG